MGEGYSRSTYDEYGAGRIDGEGKVVDDGKSLHPIMVWQRIFLWMEQKESVPTQTYRAKRTWFRIQPQKTRPQLLGAVALIQKIAGKFPVHVWGRLCNPPILAAAGAKGAEQTIIH
jgi:hypothetical protein